MEQSIAKNVHVKGLCNVKRVHNRQRGSETTIQHNINWKERHFTIVMHAVKILVIKLHLLYITDKW